MRKLVITGILIMAIVTAGFGMFGMVETKVGVADEAKIGVVDEACAGSDCGTWYTCVPRQCSQTVTYWDTWRECQDYKNAMGSNYKNCTCKRNWN